ncbi:DUF2461 domain-containing protein [Clostridioides sp. ES-S-0005-03]|uniref:DUF2461 domain-containing protein n=1 Tax=unclassified Clostridioides TaxID=2635829 RepID=UPI001D0BF8D3|nr:DUF2461 domain-containing protein [Clostridioides sp. ES-S-0001-03]MCC0681303.1 DUF2461 domain-containing protein [Clostridioides sp. ES-S-0005-03]MCC0704008.1 DUF2461 domain-containing protein [Clostridioides sp. ES-S-0049-02]UDN48184.1 DUF2461 domain-containing protein [Clostridioides sp. ES-S-0173-01]UDN57832.1 DUF2461 domain-containing protein [Clostridioides sp. ES-S-0010-02]
MKKNCILEFLNALKNNNSREWMMENKEWKKEATLQFEQLLQDIINALAYQDKSIAHLNAKDLIFRLNRDTRFSNDKSPYNPSFRAHISSAGRVPIPVGYYIDISPQNIFLGAGLFTPQLSDATTRVRDYILKHSDELESILYNHKFSENFTLDGEKLKNIPRGYPKDFTKGEYLKHKSWYIEYHLQDSDLDNLYEFCKMVTDKFLLMKPFNDYINKALEGYKMPERKA